MPVLEPRPEPRRPKMIIDIGWHPGTGEWDRQSPAGQAIIQLSNGRSKKAARGAAGVSASGMQRWFERGESALELADLDPEVPYAEQRDRVPFHLRVFADFVVQADNAGTTWARMLERRYTENVLLSSNPRDQFEVLKRTNPAEFSETPVQVQVDMALHPAAGLLADPASRAAAIALGEAMALAAARQAIEATATEGASEDG